MTPDGKSDTPRTFEYLLNALERAAESFAPHLAGYAEKRRAVLQYVENLERELNAATNTGRTNAAPQVPSSAVATGKSERSGATQPAVAALEEATHNAPVDLDHVPADYAEAVEMLRRVKRDATNTGRKSFAEIVDAAKAEADRRTNTGRKSGALELLSRIRQWDMMDVAADGKYWRKEIDAVLNAHSSPDHSDANFDNVKFAIAKRISGHTIPAKWGEAWETFKGLLAQVKQAECDISFTEPEASAASSTSPEAKP